MHKLSFSFRTFSLIPNLLSPYALGVLASLGIGVVALELGQLPVVTHLGLGALTLAVLIGLVIGNLLPETWMKRGQPGLDWSKQRLLRWGVIMYGLQLTLSDVASLGWRGMAIDACVAGSTVVLAYILGTRVFHLPRTIVLLVGTGSSFCGAAAILGAEPVVRARSEEVAVSIATVVIFGSIAMFAYPWLLRQPVIAHYLASNPTQAGLYIGSTIHEVAQVVAAGNAIGSDASGPAVISKMFRIMLLAPFLILLSALMARGDNRCTEKKDMSPRHIPIPWFAMGFLAVVLFNSVIHLPPYLLQTARRLDTFVLAAAMGALGAGTRLDTLRRVGTRPLFLGLTLALWLTIGGAAINIAFDGP